MAPDSRRAVDLQCSEFHLLTELRIGGAGTIHCPQQKYTVHEGSKDGHSRLWVYDATEKTYRNNIMSFKASLSVLHSFIYGYAVGAITYEFVLYSSSVRNICNMR